MSVRRLADANAQSASESSSLARGFAALAFVIGTFSATACLAQETVTISALIAKGGKVESVVTSQEYPFFVISTPAPDAKLFYCALSVDDALKFFDYRQSTTPASIGSRCSAIK
jgi:hypothetical protein